jgi:predicted outer membrane repeat protein
MNQSMNRGSGLKRAPLALSLSLVLAAGVVSDAFAVDNSARISAVREQIAQHRQSSSVKAALKAQRQNRLERARAKAGATSSAAPTTLGAAAVTNCNDAGAGSLRNAVETAVDGDTVDLTALACSTITLTTGSIVVGADNLTIQGPGAGALTIDANTSDVAFDFIGYGAFEIADATVTNGHYFDYCGGAIWSYYGDVVLTDAVVSNSTVEGYGYLGGAGVCNYFGDVVVTNSTLTGNTASEDEMVAMGAAAFSKYGSVVVTDSVVTGNTSESGFLGFGGAIYAGSDVSLTRSTVSNNSVSGGYWAGGGGVYLYTGTLTMTDSTISGNTSSGNGGGAFVDGLTAINSTFSGNSAGSYSGAAAVMGGDAVLTSSTITGNTAADGGGVLLVNPSSVTLNSVLAYGNTSTSPYYYGADVDGSGSKGSFPVISGSNNLIGDSLLTLPADTLSADPLLGPLANNGGPTLTHALLTGSPAIDAGNNVAGLANDQRGSGYARVVGAAADIGAFEMQQGGGDPGPGPGPVELITPRAVPAASTWALGMLALLLGLVGWRRNGR